MRPKGSQLWEILGADAVALCTRPGVTGQAYIHSASHCGFTWLCTLMYKDPLHDNTCKIRTGPSPSNTWQCHPECRNIAHRAHISFHTDHETCPHPASCIKLWLCGMPHDSPAPLPATDLPPILCKYCMHNTALYLSPCCFACLRRRLQGEMLPNFSAHKAIEHQWCLSCSASRTSPQSRCCIKCTSQVLAVANDHSPPRERSTAHMDEQAQRAPVRGTTSGIISPQNPEEQVCVLAWICSDNCSNAAHNTECKLTWRCNRKHAHTGEHKPTSCSLLWACRTDCVLEGHSQQPSNKTWPLALGSHTHSVQTCIKLWQCPLSCTSQAHASNAWFCPEAHFLEAPAPLLPETPNTGIFRRSVDVLHRENFDHVEHRQTGGWLSPNIHQLQRIRTSILERMRSAPPTANNAVSAWGALAFLFRQVEGLAEPVRPSPWFAKAGSMRDARQDQRTPLVEVFHIAIAIRMLAWPIPLGAPATPLSVGRLATLAWPLVDDSPTGLFIPGSNLCLSAWREAKFDDKYINLIEHGYTPPFKKLPLSTRRANYRS